MIIKNGKRIDGFSMDSLPIGTLQPYLGLKAPNGYLICDGSLISKTVYPDLYAICGSLFGEETETHFCLPDLRGKTVAGYDPNDDTFNILGLSLGEKTHLLTELESGVREHTHAMPLAQSAGVQDMTDVAYRATAKGAIDPEFRTGRVTGIHKTNPNDYAAPYLSGQRDANAINAHNNIQPTMVANWIVKAKMIIPVTAYAENNLTSTSETNALSAAQGKILNDTKLSLSGGVMTGPLILKMNQYMTQEEYGLDANNSDIIGVNGIYWGDDCNSQSEGLHFYKGETNGVKKYDSLMGYKGQLIWIPDNDTDTDVRKTEYTILGTHNTGDYIIEQGTKTGGWTYRKWKSGIVEAWVTLTKSLTVNQPEGTLYYDSCNFDIPSGLFTAAPTLNVSVLRSGGYGAYYTMGSISTTQCKGWVFSDLSSATAADHLLHIQAIGK